jgi:hypothetical protein
VDKPAGFVDRYPLRQHISGVDYMIGGTNVEVTISKIGHRKDVYR